jgi:hypothetical protein
LTKVLQQQGLVTVVSGLPRSGTSLLMQMLGAGGMPLLTDDHRPPDADNPRGYFEFEPVKRTAQEDGWVAGAVGKAVKVIHLLLPRLPATNRYRVLFIHRDIAEVLASQRRMLDRNGLRGADLSPQRLGELFAAQVRRSLDWAALQPQVQLLSIQHQDLIARPAVEANRINQFLGGQLDETKMAAAVDPSLYRHRHDLTSEQERKP